MSTDRLGLDLVLLPRELYVLVNLYMPNYCP